MTAARLPRLSATQRRALIAVLTSGRGAFESLSGWRRGVYSKGPAMFFTGGEGTFRWATGEALVDAGLLINVVVCAARLTPHWWSVTLTDVALTRVRESYRVTWRRLTPCRCGHHATDTRCHVDGCSC